MVNLGLKYQIPNTKLVHCIREIFVRVIINIPSKIINMLIFVGKMLII